MKFRADKTDIKRYVEEGWWEASKGLAEFVRENAQRNPSGIAYRTSESQISWNEYFHAAIGLAEQIKCKTTNGGEFSCGFLTVRIFTFVISLARWPES